MVYKLFAVVGKGKVDEEVFTFPDLVYESGEPIFFVLDRNTDGSTNAVTRNSSFSGTPKEVLARKKSINEMSFTIRFRVVDSSFVYRKPIFDNEFSHDEEVNKMWYKENEEDKKEFIKAVKPKERSDEEIIKDALKEDRKYEQKVSKEMRKEETTKGLKVAQVINLSRNVVEIDLTDSPSPKRPRSVIVEI